MIPLAAMISPTLLSLVRFSRLPHSCLSQICSPCNTEGPTFVKFLGSFILLRVTGWFETFPVDRLFDISHHWAPSEMDIHRRRSRKKIRFGQIALSMAAKLQSVSVI